MAPFNHSDGEHIDETASRSFHAAKPPLHSNWGFDAGNFDPDLTDYTPDGDRDTTTAIKNVLDV